MQILDDQGRLFGRVNIIDAGVLVVACLLIPLAYGGYLLFRTLPPRIVAIVPPRVAQGTTQVNVRGQNLRPYLRVTVGVQDAPLLFETPDAGLLRLPSLEPGSYDVTLFDRGREIERVAGALVIESTPQTSSVSKAASPTSSLVAIGVFRGLDDKGAKALAQDLRTLRQQGSSWGQVASFQPAEPSIEYLWPESLPVFDGTSQIRAVLQLRCVVAPGECRVQDVSLISGATVPLDIRGTSRPFVVQEVHPAYTGALELTVAVPAVSREMMSILTTGTSARERFPDRDALRPVVVSIDIPSDESQTAILRLRVPIVNNAEPWRYKGRTLRLGDQFVLEDPLFTLSGLIQSVKPVAAAAAPAEK